MNQVAESERNEEAQTARDGGLGEVAPGPGPGQEGPEVLPRRGRRQGGEKRRSSVDVLVGIYKFIVYVIFFFVSNRHEKYSTVISKLATAKK